MVSASAVKSKLDTVLQRSDLKRNVLVNHYSTARNAFGETAKTFTTQDVFEGIVVGYRAYKHRLDPQGDYPNSEFVIYLPIDDSVSKEDTVEMFSTEYSIVGIDKFPLGTLLVAQRIFVEEKLD